MIEERVGRKAGLMGRKMERAEEGAELAEEVSSEEGVE